MELVKDNRGKTPTYVIEDDPEAPGEARIRNQFNNKTQNIGPRPIESSAVAKGMHLIKLQESLR